MRAGLIAQVVLAVLACVLLGGCAGSSGADRPAGVSTRSTTGAPRTAPAATVSSATRRALTQTVTAAIRAMLDGRGGDVCVHLTLAGRRRLRNAVAKIDGFADTCSDAARHALEIADPPPGLLDPLRQPRLTEIVVRGATATARLGTKTRGPGRARVSFENVRGVWLIDDYRPIGCSGVTCGGLPEPA